ncbi:MAG: type I-A CRISPR-associated protein Cas4/Csa1 [Thermoplasmata archaeon]
MCKDVVILYYLNDVEAKLIMHKIMPQARKTGVSDDLRGWSWYKSPMKPFYDDVKLPMFLICSRYCPTNRDIYLNRVLNKKGDINFNVSQGMTLHEVVGQLILLFQDGQLPAFEEWWEKNKKHISFVGKTESQVELLKERSRKVWEHTLQNLKAEVSNRTVHQPYSSKRDIIATAVPFLVEHRLSGELLGLSGILGIDCFDYLRNIVFDLKIIDGNFKMESWHRLYPTGYALVLESLYEIPVEIGCIVYVWFKDNSLVSKKDIFFINDDLRSWWLEERDKKLEIVAQKKDPGVSPGCYEECIYYRECRGE